MAWKLWCLETFTKYKTNILVLHWPSPQLLGVYFLFVINKCQTKKDKKKRKNRKLDTMERQSGNWLHIKRKKGKEIVRLTCSAHSLKVANTSIVAYSVCFFFGQPIHLGHLILLCFTKVEKFYSLLIGALAISESICNFYRNIPVMMLALLHSTLSHTYNAGMLYWSAGSSSGCSAFHLASY